jgi:MFS-type transporter involved in bile tolerance (Atg22 family)
MYDWANSAFATTILAVILPIYFSQVAGATLPSAAVATSYWSFGLSLSLLIIAILSPILGTISDVLRGKKKFLAFFAGLGITGTALLVLVDTGDWVLASILAIIGRIGFNGANSFYDALLPHVARSDDQDRVSAMGYAMGYLGGGLLLAINIVMLQYLPGTWGARLSFLSVAVWWAVFSIPLFRNIPEPPAATARFKTGLEVIAASFKRLWATLKDIQQFSQLFKFLLAFLIYNDGIGTIIGVAAIYGAELGFGSGELIPALLLVQFVGIPFSLIFGRLPRAGDRRRSFFLAFILFNIFALPLVGISGSRLLPVDLSGAPAPAFSDTATSHGEGVYSAQDPAIRYTGAWSTFTVPAKAFADKQDVTYAVTLDPGAAVSLAFNGQKIRLLYSQGPDFGIWAVEIDGQPFLDEDTGVPKTIDAYSPTTRYDISIILDAGAPGEHVLRLVNSAEKNPASQANRLSLASVEVLPPVRSSNLVIILSMIIGLELFGLLLAWLLGGRLFAGLAEKMNTQRSVLLALFIYAIIAIWGFFIDSVVEFWFLAWMVAVVQGGSQALSRSLYASMSPASKSGEFFGLFGIMEKFSAILGPLLFGLAGTLFGSSRPAVLSLIVLFILGGYLLMKVDVETGREAARGEDQRILRSREVA